MVTRTPHPIPDEDVNLSVSDAELIVRIAAGDREALTTLFRRRHLDVYRLALHMTGNSSVAEDVVQEVFLAVMADAARYDGARSNVKAWLCGIARNHALRHLDAERRMAPLDVARDTNEPPSSDDGVLDDLARAERLDALRRAILSLPVRYREAVVLCDLEELTYAEAADAIGCAVGTVRSRLHRGRALLAAKMSAAHSDEETTNVRHARCPA